LAGTRIVHFTTHDFLNNKAPELSGLVLSLLNREGKPGDAFRLRDIYNLSLNADLVVLSGCRTGGRPDVLGEGLLGLTCGVLYAGLTACDGESMFVLQGDWWEKTLRP
jgi:CHAT domain-containing protein